MGERIECIIEHDVQIENDEGRMVKGVRATCDCCGAITESFGTSSASVRRCLALMREECEQGEGAFFYADDGSDE